MIPVGLEESDEPFAFLRIFRACLKATDLEEDPTWDDTKRMLPYHFPQIVRLFGPQHMFQVVIWI